MTNYLEFGNKNVEEVQAELDYFKGKAEQLEGELAGTDHELNYLRKQYKDCNLLQEQILELEK